MPSQPNFNYMLPFIRYKLESPNKCFVRDQGTLNYD